MSTTIKPGTRALPSVRDLELPNGATDTSTGVTPPIRPALEDPVASGPVTLTPAPAVHVPIASTVTFETPRRAAPGTVEVRDAQGATAVYKIQKPLGHGAAGSAFLATAPDGQQVVVKIPNAIGTIHEQRLRTEAAAYAAVDGAPEIPRFFGMGVDEHGFPALVTQFIAGEPLHSTEGTRSNPSKSVRIMRKVLNAIDALNEKGLGHRDLARGNILIQGDASESVKVFDLGMAAKVTEPYEWGGPKYYAPEQTAGKPSLGRMNGDIYSVGAHLLELISGLEPTPENMTQALAKVPERVATLDGQRTTLRQVIERSLDPDPATRLQNAKQMLHLLLPFASMP